MIPLTHVDMAAGPDTSATVIRGEDGRLHHVAPLETWSRSWPTEPGHYWLHGWTDHYRDKPAGLHLLRLALSGNNVMLGSGAGDFVMEHNGAGGRWAPALFPALPVMDRGGAHSPASCPGPTPTCSAPTGRPRSRTATSSNGPLLPSPHPARP